MSAQAEKILNALGVTRNDNVKVAFNHRHFDKHCAKIDEVLGVKAEEPKKAPAKRGPKPKTAKA